jgi:hypothetical protein
VTDSEFRNEERRAKSEELGAAGAAFFGCSFQAIRSSSMPEGQNENFDQ